MTISKNEEKLHRSETFLFYFSNHFTWLKEGLYDTMDCTAWDFDQNDNLGNTWTSEWNLVCDNEYLYVLRFISFSLFFSNFFLTLTSFPLCRKTVAEMFFLVGVATGGIISGYLSDKFGRKKMLFISAVLQTIFGE